MGEKIKFSTKILSGESVNLDTFKKISWATNQHIRIISEGSCDTWRNDAEMTL